MKIVLQYVSLASVTVDGAVIAAINTGYVLLVAFSPQDNQSTLESMARKIISIRTIPDSNHKINLSILDINGQILVIPQFTLYADTHKGYRPNFIHAALPPQAKALFSQFIHLLKQHYPHIQTGQFGTYMQVEMTNNGPITLIIEN
jgi:D-aminoacyl-tRNA deacylase